MPLNLQLFARENTTSNMNQMIQCRKAKCFSTALFPWYPAALNVPVSEYNDKCTAGFSGSIFFPLCLYELCSKCSEFSTINGLLRAWSKQSFLIKKQNKAVLQHCNWDLFFFFFRPTLSRRSLYIHEVAVQGPSSWIKSNKAHAGLSVGSANEKLWRERYKRSASPRCQSEMGGNIWKIFHYCKVFSCDLKIQSLAMLVW